MFEAATPSSRVSVTFSDYTRNESIQCLEEYDVVLDTVGKRRTSELKKACAHALRAGGKYLSIDDEALVLRSDRLHKITELVELGVIKPMNDRVYPFEQMIDAHRYVELGHKKGNVAITVHKAT